MEGDHNSKLFHAKASARKKKNTISMLVDDEGRIQTSEEGITHTVCSFFSQLFQSDNPSIEELDEATVGLSCKINGHKNGIISCPFEREEVRALILEMGPTKAPGPDGFRVVFFQKFGEVVGEDVEEICVKVCVKVLNRELSIKEFNQTHVVLVPKVKNPQSMKEFRPISCCRVIYKDVSKCLANRLKLILPDIIYPCQSEFVPDRLIFDNVLISFELLHSIHHRKKGKKGLVAIKLDMSKAYDRVEWNFLRCVMEKLGFPHQWIELVMECLSTSNLSFVINGQVMGKMVPSRGLRQGCPLSPYLFILCAEVLSNVIKRVENNGRGLGIRCCRGVPLVSHLFFVDDSILFCKASLKNGL
ncbi:hypothetical protein Dsin_001914 [Dipteronia sinensis]|uniref:Reverse transcriptase domain-containing protein n=1 Tax=Dipteronia sinensis TaxID=43782 RepID=A0AAE0EIS4_9ROSI|nr:hypothetical protein Dsin_001914 [Dipteronia sinensis]